MYVLDENKIKCIKEYGEDFKFDLVTQQFLDKKILTTSMKIMNANDVIRELENLVFDGAFNAKAYNYIKVIVYYKDNPIIGYEDYDYWVDEVCFI